MKNLFSILVSALLAVSACAQTTTLTINKTTGQINAPTDGGAVPNFTTLKVGGVVIATSSSTNTFTNKTIVLESNSVSFTPTGTGAVSRDLAAFLKEHAMKPKDFGAVGDGSTDDTTAMQALFAAAQAARRPIWITGGSAGFKISDTLVINTTGQLIFGDGDAVECPSRIIQTGAAKHGIEIRIPGTRTTGSISASTASLVVASATGFTAGQTIQINGAGVAGANCERVIDTVVGTTITLTVAVDTTVTSATVFHSGSNHYITISDLYIVNSNGAGTSTGHGVFIDLDSTLNSFVDQVSLLRCRVDGFRTGLKAVKWSNSHVFGCEFFSNYNGVSVGGNCATDVFHNTNIGTFSNIGFIATGTTPGFKFDTCQMGNGPKAMLLMSGGDVTIDGMRVESLSGSPLDGSAADVGFEVQTNAQLQAINVGCNNASITTLTMFRYATGSGGRLHNCSLTQSSGTVNLLKCTTSSGIPVTYDADDLVTAKGTVKQYDTAFSSLLSTYYASPGVTVQNSGLPAADASLRGRTWLSMDDTVGDLGPFLGARLASGTAVNAPLAFTLNGGTVQKNFGLAASKVFALDHDVQVTMTSGTGVVWKFYWDNFTNDEFSIYRNGNPRFYHDGLSNRTSIGHNANTQPSGTATLNVEGTLSVTSTIINGAALRFKSYTVGTLPAGTLGDTAVVTDATLPTYLGALVGGGAVVTPVFYNGAAWVSY